MSDLSTVNLWSLGIVSGELDATIDLAEKSWSEFVSDSNDRTHLKAVSHHLSQIAGALKVVNIRGLDLLANELAAFSIQAIDSEKPLSKPQYSAMAAGITGLGRYLTWLKNKGRGQPELLIPLINDLRLLNGNERMREHSLSEFSHAGEFKPPEGDAADIDLEKLGTTGRRIRQMYQLGLIRIFRDPKPVAHLVVMQRACERMYGMLRSTAAAERWLMTAAVITGLANKELQLTRSRIRWLSSVDGSLRKLIRDPESVLAEQLDEEDRSEMLYLLALMPNSNPLADLLTQQFSWQVQGNDTLFANDRDFVYGVGQQIEQQQLSTLREMLNTLREELGALGEDEAPDSLKLGGLSTHLGAILLELGTVGGDSLKELLQARQAELQQWVENTVDVSASSLAPLADSLVMLDSVLCDSHTMPINTELPTAENATERALQAAQLTVVTEAQADLNLAKRGITAFMEADFDSAELSSIITSLEAVRGSMQFLQVPRAANILQRCEQFLESKTAEDLREEPGLLETLADALVSLEYFLQISESGQNLDASVLDLADESLEAVGFPA